ncbi:MAG: alpha-L-glutamate ligase-like protein [bacterium]|nr:alpha-L-glutamate ligase-like protein [bacterium]
MSNVVKTYWEWLREGSILCMNRRNAEYILLHNPRAYYRVVDEKLETKALAEGAGVPCPRTYAVVRSYGEVGEVLGRVLREHQTLVIKPNRGAAGRGVMVLEREGGGGWRKASGAAVSEMEMRYHVTSILSGLYSLSELPDQAIIEQRIFPHPFFKEITWQGTPDVRIILYHTIPVMAMMRLPTRQSDGRANLHQGAVGLGIAIAKGTTRTGVCRGRRVLTHPDTGAPLQGLRVPDWGRALEISRLLARRIPLQYIGVDLMLDAAHGPMMIEANARPGLSIQVANSLGLRRRLEFLQGRLARGATPDEVWEEFYVRIGNDEL